MHSYRSARPRPKSGKPSRASGRSPVAIADRPFAQPHPVPRTNSACACGGGCPKCRNRPTAQTAVAGTARPAAAGSGPPAVGRRGDRFERQADRIADRAAEGPARATSRPDRPAGARPDPGRADRSRPDPVDRAGPGRPLDDGVRADMTSRMGFDLGKVRIHDCAAADASARALGARAYTAGTHIVFRAGEYDPATRGGRRLLAHELAHVAQQTHVGRADGWSPEHTAPMVQREPSSDAEPDGLTEAEMELALHYNRSYFRNLPDAPQLIEVIRDHVLHIEPSSAIDEEFVNAVYFWQGVVGLEQDGQLGPRTGPALTGMFIGDGGLGRCEADGQPFHRPSGTINGKPGENYGVQIRYAKFRTFADFKSDPANGVFPSCCEVRQDIKWDQDFADALPSWHKGLPHSGFDEGTPADKWVEDRNEDKDHRYGYRSDPYPEQTDSDQFLDEADIRNTAFGHKYRGGDSPWAIKMPAGTYTFRLRVVDVCNDGKDVATSAELKVNWGDEPMR